MTTHSEIAVFYTSLIRKLQVACGETGVEVLSAYGKRRATYPLKSPIVIAEIKSLTLPIFEGTTVGTDKNGQKYCATPADIDLSLRIYIPKTFDGKTCYTILDTLINALLNNTAITLKTPYCEKLEYNRNAGAVVLSAGAKLCAYFV